MPYTLRIIFFNKHRELNKIIKRYDLIINKTIYIGGEVRDAVDVMVMIPSSLLDIKNKLFLYSYGTRGRTRTGTLVRARDFESLMSTNFITLAKLNNNHFIFRTKKINHENI